MKFVVYFVVDSYDWLVNGTAQAKVETFMEEEHSFDEYTKVGNHKVEFRFLPYLVVSCFLVTVIV